MDANDLAFLSIGQLAPLIKRRDVSPVELVQLFLDRIATHDDRLRAYVTVTGELALMRARQAERDIARGDYLGLLHGIPFGIKDQFATNGIRTTAGSRLLADNVPDYDATVIERLHNAGAILLGKQNMAEFAIGGTIDWPYGTARNPWNLRHSPGGSSSGSGSAVAAGLATFSIGEDTGGSIRVPAACNGVTGLRPTHGRVSRYGCLPYCWSSDTVGPLAHTSEDCAIITRVIAGYDARDPISSRRPVPDYQTGLNGEIRGLRIGAVREALQSTKAETQEAIQAALRALEDLGVICDEVSIPLAHLAGALHTACCDVDCAGVHYERLRGPDARLYDRATRVRLMTASLVPATLYNRAAKGRDLLRRQVIAAFQEVDVLLSPTLEGPAPQVEETQARWASIENVLNSRFKMASYTGVYSLAGCPAISIPCNFTAKGLPLGLQLIGRPFDEATILRVAHHYQLATSWHAQNPPLHSLNEQNTGL